MGFCKLSFTPQCLKSIEKKPSYPSSSLVIMEVHQLSSMVLAPSLHVHFSLSDVDEVFGEPSRQK